MLQKLKDENSKKEKRNVGDFKIDLAPNGFQKIRTLDL